MSEVQLEKANDGDVQMEASPVEPVGAAPPPTATEPPKRRPRLDLNAEPRKRGGKSMFGILVGTLNKAKVEDKQRNASEAAKKRQVLEARLLAKLSKETDAVRRTEEAKRDRILANRKEEELALKDGIIRHRHLQLPRLAGFLATSDTIPPLPDSPSRTTTQILAQIQPPRSHPPPLYYLPAILTPEQEAFISNRRDLVKEAIEKEWQEWQIEKKTGIEEVRKLRARVEELTKKFKEEAQQVDDARQEAETEDKIPIAQEDSVTAPAAAEERATSEKRDLAVMDEDDAVEY